MEIKTTEMDVIAICNLKKLNIPRVQNNGTKFKLECKNKSLFANCVHSQHAKIRLQVVVDREGHQLLLSKIQPRAVVKVAATTTFKLVQASSRPHLILVRPRLLNKVNQNTQYLPSTRT